MTVQCPQCELIFASKSELAWHLEEDHRDRRPGTQGDGPAAKGDGAVSRWAEATGVA